MKFAEKIYTCRKKAGLSQDGLAEQLGVSRQTISKWENGEALPETSKLPGLAKALGVSIDWLLDEDGESADFSTGSADTAEKAEADPTTQGTTGSPVSAQREGQQAQGYMLDRLPGILAKLASRWGWLTGVYVACGSGGIALIGGIAKAAVGSMVRLTDSMDFGSPFGASGGMVIYDQSGNPLTGAMADAIQTQLGLGGADSMTQTVLANNPVSALANCMIVIGLLGVIGGVALALWLYQKRDEL